MENSWTKAANDGKKVDVNIKPVYNGTSKRPAKYEVDYTIDGTIYEKEFKNGG